MYLKQLYKHSKLWFAFVCFFIGMQLFINVKKGITISPFYHYGMYSARIEPEKAYAVFEVYVNHQPLALNDFSPKIADKILYPLMEYHQQECNHVFYEQTVHRLLLKTGIQPRTHYFKSDISEASFLDWYRSYLETMMEMPVDDVEVKLVQYEYVNGFRRKHELPLKTSACY